MRLELLAGDRFVYTPPPDMPLTSWDNQIVYLQWDQKVFNPNDDLVSVAQEEEDGIARKTAWLRFLYLTPLDRLELSTTETSEDDDKPDEDNLTELYRLSYDSEVAGSGTIEMNNRADSEDIRDVLEENGYVVEITQIRTRIQNWITEL